MRTHQLSRRGGTVSRCPRRHLAPKSLRTTQDMLERANSWRRKPHRARPTKVAVKETTKRTRSRKVAKKKESFQELVPQIADELKTEVNSDATAGTTAETPIIID
eukprot:TRINITY_DN9439_c0_g1_i1.p1 TRINITY_DN9439_c0_g1~~TRINITY_DN9439_c0_g1_i1.p1  ORF type:complete len:105 (+),score=5.96 TRINITY_DN9439_c0_g1_i1:47-361(+)